MSDFLNAAKQQSRAVFVLAALFSLGGSSAAQKSPNLPDNNAQILRQFDAHLWHMAFDSLGKPSIGSALIETEQRTCEVHLETRHG